MAFTEEAWKRQAKLSGVDREISKGHLGVSYFAIWRPGKRRMPEPAVFIYVNVAAHGTNRLDLLNTCAHEATHAAVDLFGYIGEKNLEGEPFAYLVAEITEILWKHARKEARRGRNRDSHRGR
jgi:hypothetical protein